ncbi:MAG: NlpC/P60 family protein [Pseudomonadota bacterium]
MICWRDTVNSTLLDKKDGVRLAFAAEQLIGKRFRLHGRDPETGLDCVGLVHVCLQSVGREMGPIRGYRLKNTSIDCWLQHAHSAGLVLNFGGLEPGDIVLISPGPLQHHLMIADTTGAFIHAHASLGRIVRQKQTYASSNIIKKWRLTALKKE